MAIILGILIVVAVSALAALLVGSVVRTGAEDVHDDEGEDFA